MCFLMNGAGDTVGVFKVCVLLSFILRGVGNGGGGL